MFCSKASAVFFRGNYFKRFVIPEHGKDDVTDFMHDGSHYHGLFLAGTFPDVIIIDHRIYRCAAPFINFYIIESGHMQDASGKAGTPLGHMHFIAVQFPGLFDSRIKAKVSIEFLWGRKQLKGAHFCDQNYCAEESNPMQ